MFDFMIYNTNYCNHSYNIFETLKELRDIYIISPTYNEHLKSFNYEIQHSTFETICLTYIRTIWKKKNNIIFINDITFLSLATPLDLEIEACNKDLFIHENYMALSKGLAKKILKTDAIDKQLCIKLKMSGWNVATPKFDH